MAHASTQRHSAVPRQGKPKQIQQQAHLHRVGFIFTSRFVNSSLAGQLSRTPQKYSPSRHHP
eukprot:708389-Amphidinium_carterae.1